MATEIEARYKLTNKLLEKSGINQVLELAAGYTSRGLIYSEKGFNYVEMDLDNVSKNKVNIIKSIKNDIPKNLHIINVNELSSSDYFKCDKYFEENKPRKYELKELQIGQQISLGNLNIVVVSLAGHTKGSVGFVPMIILNRLFHLYAKTKMEI